MSRNLAFIVEAADRIAQLYRDEQGIEKGPLVLNTEVLSQLNLSNGEWQRIEQILRQESPAIMMAFVPQGRIFYTADDLDELASNLFAEPIPEWD